MLRVRINQGEVRRLARTLVGLVGRLEDRTELHAGIAERAEVLVREHVRNVAAPSRHTTADRLGATRTGYLERAGEGVESRGTAEAAVVTISGNVDIFKRTDGPVTVRGRGKKLTIPARAAAYGRRAGEISGLEVRVFGRRGGGRTVALGKVEGGVREVWYWLVDQVTLPQDRGLLPSDEQFAASAELAARDYVDSLLERADGQEVLA
jgi:hypothetical protein